MADKIGPQHGLEAARLRENEYHPGIVAWDKRTDTLKKLAANNDEFVDRVGLLEQEVAALRARPFA